MCKGDVRHQITHTYIFRQYIYLCMILTFFAHKLTSHRTTYTRCVLADVDMMFTYLTATLCGDLQTWNTQGDHAEPLYTAQPLVWKKWRLDCNTVLFMGHSGVPFPGRSHANLTWTRMMRPTKMWCGRLVSRSPIAVLKTMGPAVKQWLGVFMVVCQPAAFQQKKGPKVKHVQTCSNLTSEAFKSLKLKPEKIN